MKAFVNDNLEYSKITKDVAPDNSIFTANDPIEDWVTVIGGIGEGQSYLDIKPSDIIISISQPLKDKITNANSKDTSLLIAWVNAVLQENDMALLSSGDYGQSAGGQGFVIALDSDKKNSQNGTIIKGEDLAKKDPTFGDFLNYVDYDKDSNNFIGKRLLLQDDVFSFKHQGSLVEEILVEKLEKPNATTINNKKDFAATQGESDKNSDKTDVTIKDEKILTPDVTLETKKRNLNVILSSMAGVRITAICHPWLKLARPIYIKGMGFWDGKYTVLKLVHTLNEDNKFITKINACRILPANDSKEKLKAKLISDTAQNNPSAKYADKNVRSSNGYTSSTNVNSYGPDISVLPPTQLMTEFNSKGQTYNTPSKLRSSLENRIANLHPDYQNIFRGFISEFESTYPKYKVLITGDYRTFQRSYELKYGIGGSPSNPNSNGGNGEKATIKNATPGRSFHNYGLAIDINITDNFGVVIASKYSSQSLWKSIGILDIAKKWKLRWGGTFNNYQDNVHFEIQGFDSKILLLRAQAQFGNDPNKIQGNRLNFTGSDDLKRTSSSSYDPNSIKNYGFSF